MKKKFYRVLIQILAAIMVLAAVPAVSMPVFAGQTSFDISNGNIVIETDTVNGGCKLTQNSATSYHLTSIPITGTTTQYAITVEADTCAAIIINNLDIDLTSSTGINALSLTSGAAVNLTLSGDNTLKSGENAAGIDVPQNSSLTVDGSGTLDVYGGINAAGIGGNYNQILGDISIADGTVNAYGGDTSSFYSGAGIGGGGAGYGDSTKPDYSKISISGGEVNAYGGTGTDSRNGAAGIGGPGYLTITISGGMVYARGGDGDDGGAGIGTGGGGGQHIAIAITGGAVTAAGSMNGGAGIGAGETDNSITGSDITAEIDKDADVTAYAQGWGGPPAIFTSGSEQYVDPFNYSARGGNTLTNTSDAYVLMTDFYNSLNGNTGDYPTVKFYNSGGTVVSTTVPEVNYAKSIAATVPSADSYVVYANNGYSNGYWYRSTSFDTTSLFYPVTSAGLTAYTVIGTSYGGFPTQGLSSSVGSGNYMLSGSAVTVDSGLSLNSFDSGIEKATVMIRNFKNGDALTLPATVGAIIGSYDSGTGILSLSGSDTQGNYQNALRSIKFSTTSTDTTDRIIDFSIGSGLYSSATGHFYEYVPVSGKITWSSAKSAAESRSLFGRTGYLITITSEAESAFIKTKVTGTGWIGAQDIDSLNGTADWRWVTGSERLEDSGKGLAFYSSTGTNGSMSGAAVDDMYTNWAEHQPDNWDTGETVAQMYADGSNLGQWNDLPTTEAVAGYFVEYGDMTGDSSVALTSSKTITIHSSSSPSDPPDDSDSGSGGHSISDSSGAPVNVNGVDYSAGTAENSTEDGRSVTTVTVDTAKLKNILDSQADKPSVIIPVTSGAKIASGVLTGQMVDDMKGREATLSLKTDSVTYTLPASEININDISKQLGEDVELSDIVVDIRISEPSDDTASVVENAAEDGGFTIMIPAIDFAITCSYNGKTVEADVFDVYVQRLVLVPDGVDPDKITTGVVVRPDGTSYHVPTEIKEIDGKYYAVINSLTNSTYTVVWHPVEFTDVANHWAKTAVNDMGSRMVISGVGGNLFEPGRNITRAEFAAIVVRALGLDTGIGEGTFSDISDSDWYSGYIKTAVGYGIINGIGDGTFRPNSSITREQAMTMIARAMKITGLQSELSDTETTSLLSGYTDHTAISDYAKINIVSCIEAGVVLGRDDGTIAPAEYITRAEVAVIAQRLLQKSGLI